MTNTATSAYLDRFKAREKFVGEDGSTFTLRQLRPAEIFHVRDMCKDADKSTFNVMTGIASVCEADKADGSHVVYTFPKNRRDLDFILNAVGIKGIKALTVAFNKLNVDEADEPRDGADEGDEADAA